MANNDKIISLEEYKLVLWSLGLNENGIDVELYYKIYKALKTGTEKDMIKAKNTLYENQNANRLRRFN